MKTYCLSFAFLVAASAHANNIQVTNVTLVDNTGTSAKVQFDISWENSWRGGGVANWDAAWVFVKVKQSNGVWVHARLGNGGHTAPAGSMLDMGLVSPDSAYNAISNPVVGVFLRRDADGNGTFTATAVQLAWPYGAQGIIASNDIAEVKVFAIEMVYVNEGAFAVGSGGSADNEFTLTTINTPLANVVPVGVGSLGGAAGGHPTGQLQLPVAAWPNGYDAFYCMKYEISQQQYVDFLNTLNRAQQDWSTDTDLPPGLTSVVNRYVMSNTPVVFARNGIRCPATIDPLGPVEFFCDLNGNGVGGESDDGQWVACGNLSWAYDLGPFLDWSGLRWMTELEFEKSCRGPLVPVPGEFPWGSAVLGGTSPNIGAAGTASESISSGYVNTGGNVNLDTSYPVRVGVFAAHPSNTGRITAGAGYYGAMELSGNVIERVISLYQTWGLGYTGRHGDGTINASGGYSVGGWPQFVTQAVSVRGGMFGSISTVSLQVSSRPIPTLAYGDRTPGTGGRGVRTAP